MAKNLPNLGNEIFHLRMAVPQDCQLVWKWANDPAVRQNSFSAEPIPWETHKTWFDHILTDSSSLFLIAIESDHPIGQVRFKIESSQAIISVSLAQDRRGKGLGSKIIGMASRYLVQSQQINVIHAYIKPDNLASIRSFIKAGYIFGQETEVNHHLALDYIFPKEQTQ